MFALRLRRPAIQWKKPITELVVAGGTVALILAALGYILRFSVNAPVVDEWDLTQVVLGGMSLWDWSFTRLNEHLFIPANAAFWMLHKVSGLDFRVGMMVNLLVHAAAVLILLRAARHIRGRASLADLIIPATLLHWGHAYNLLMSYQLAFGLFVLSAALILWVIATAEVGREGRTAMRGSLVLLLLMLNGGMGVAFVPVLGLWIAVLAWKSKRKLPFLFLPMAAAYVLIAIFGAPKVAAAPTESLSSGRLTWCVVQYLGMGTGLWYDGPHWPRNGIVIAMCYLFLSVALTIAMIRRRDGGRSAGLLAFLLSHFAVAAGIAISRGGGIAERYVTISTVGLLAAYLAMLTFKFPRWLEWFGPAVAVALIAVNIAPGERYGHNLRSVYRGLQRDLKEGMPIGFLRDKYQDRLRVGDNLEPALERLRSRGIREFAGFVPTPTMREFPIDDVKDWLLPQKVTGYQVEIVVSQPLTWSEIRLTWNGGKSAVVYPPRSPGTYRLRLWVNDTVVLPKLTVTPDSIKVVRTAWLIPALP